MTELDLSSPEHEPQEPANPELEPGQQKREFLIENYPQWREIWDHWPQEMRDYFIPIIEAGRLTPKLYRDLMISVEIATDDKEMKHAFAHYGLNDQETDKRYVAAEVDYWQRAIILYPELKREVYSPAMRQHVVSHELGHLLSEVIDPEKYKTIVARRMEDLSWANGKYIQDLQESQSKEVPHELMADDMGDYLRIKDGTIEERAAQLVLARWDRADTKESFDARPLEERQALLEEAKQLIQFFDDALNDEKREQAVESGAYESYQTEWLEDDGLVDFNFIQEMPMSLAQPIGNAMQSKPKSKSWVDWLFFAGMEMGGAEKK